MGRGLLKDRVALVTGAGQGLGEAIARELAEEGAAVGLIEINPVTAGRVKAELEMKGYPVLAFPISVTDYDRLCQGDCANGGAVGTYRYPGQ